MPSTHLCLHYHIVFSVKARRRDIAAQWRGRLHAYLAGAISQGGGMPVIVGGVADHVHLLAGLRATHRLADVIRDTKSSSAVWVQREFGLARFQWQEGYGGFTVSPSHIKSVRAYIANRNNTIARKHFRKNICSFLTTVELNMTSAICGDPTVAPLPGRF